MARRSALPPSSQSSAADSPARAPLAMLKAVFTHHLQLRHQGRGLSVALAPQADGSPRLEDTAPPHADQRALQMHTALRSALDAVPNSRKVFLHLATVEHHLWRSGALFLHDLSPQAARRTLEQLDGAAKPPLAPGLAALRECLVDVIAAQERLQRKLELLQPRSSFFVDHKLEVSEASHSDFDRAIAGPASDGQA